MRTKKNLRISATCALIALSVVLVACGHPSDTLAKKGPPPSGKPYDSSTDEGPSAQALWLMADFSYLSEALLNLVSMGKTSNPCRIYRYISGGLEATAPSAAQLDFEVLNQCYLQIGNSTAQLEGRERFTIKNLQRQVDPGSGFGSVAFQEATVMFLEPHKIHLVDPLMKGLYVTHSLRVRRDTHALFTYKFDLESRWATAARDLNVYPYVGDWTTRIQGLVRLGAAVEGSDLFSLIVSQRAEFQMRKGGSGDQRVIGESQSLGLALGENLAKISKAGLPLAKWQGVYSTTQMPGEQTALDFETTAKNLVNLKLRKSYLISHGSGPNIDFVRLSVEAARLHYQSH